MTEKRIPVAEYSSIRLCNLPGDLKVHTWAEREILATSGGELNINTQAAEISITCDRGCELTLPPDLNLRFDHIGGDAHIMDLAASIEGNTVGGDLILAGAGAVKIGSVSGDVTAECVAGNLQLGSVGGDLAVDSLAANLAATVGGDMKLSLIAGAISATTGGDAHLEYASMDEGTHAVQAGGNVYCALPPQASATLNLQYGGSLRTSQHFTRHTAGRHLSRMVLGNGKATLTLIAGGDMTLLTDVDEAYIGPSEYRSEQDFGGEFAHQTEEFMGQVTDSLNIQLAALTQQLNAQLGSLPNGEEITARVQERIQKAIERAEHRINSAVIKAERQAAQAKKRSEKAKVRADRLMRPSSPPAPVPPTEPVGEAERTAIMRMLEEGKLTVEQAEALLSAMGA